VRAREREEESRLHPLANLKIFQLLSPPSPSLSLCFPLSVYIIYYNLPLIISELFDRR